MVDRRDLHSSDYTHSDPGTSPQVRGEADLRGPILRAGMDRNQVSGGCEEVSGGEGSGSFGRYDAGTGSHGKNRSRGRSTERVRRKKVKGPENTDVNRKNLFRLIREVKLQLVGITVDVEIKGKRYIGLYKGLGRTPPRLPPPNKMTGVQKVCNNNEKLNRHRSRSVHNRLCYRCSHRR